MRWYGLNDEKRRVVGVPGVDALGALAMSGEKTEFGGLQAADIIASIGRRLEKETVFQTVDLDPETLREFEAGCPLFHVPLGDDRLPGYC